MTCASTTSSSSAASGSPRRAPARSTSSPRTPKRSSAGCPTAPTADIDRAVAAAREAFDHGPWPRMTLAERAAVIGRLAEIYAASAGRDGRAHHRGDGLADHLLAAGAGAAAARMLQYYAELGADVPVGGAAARHARAGDRAPRAGRRRRRPIVPWNVPQFVTMSKLAPALLAGCTIVLKPAPETPLDAYLLAEMLDGGRHPDGRRQHRRRPAARSASTSSATRASTRSRSPARPRPGRAHRRDLRRAAQALSASSSAASRPRSSSTTPTSRATHGRPDDRRR